MLCSLPFNTPTPPLPPITPPPLSSSPLFLSHPISPHISHAYLSHIPRVALAFHIFINRTSYAPCLYCLSHTSFIGYISQIFHHLSHTHLSRVYIVRVHAHVRAHAHTAHSLHVRKIYLLPLIDVCSPTH